MSDIRGESPYSGWACREDVAELDDAEVSRLLVDERSEAIGAARDAAFERGMDAFSEVDDRDVLANMYFDHATLIADFKAGWDTAALEERRARGDV